MTLIKRVYWNIGKLTLFKFIKCYFEIKNQIKVNYEYAKNNKQFDDIKIMDKIKKELKPFNMTKESINKMIERDKKEKEWFKKKHEEYLENKKKQLVF
jgi:hypothetical protein